MTRDTVQIGMALSQGKSLGMGVLNLCPAHGTGQVTLYAVPGEGSLLMVGIL